MDIGRISIVNCSPDAAMAVAFEGLLRQSFGSNVKLQHDSGKGHEQGVGGRDKWNSDSPYCPNIVFMMACRESFGLLTQILQNRRITTAAPIIVTVERAVP